MTIRHRTRLVMGVLLVMAGTAINGNAMAAARAPQAATPTNATLDGVTKAILRLPYYGPFDGIGVSVDKGTVTLSGSVYALGLKRDAERAVKRVAGVDQVINNITELPPSPSDNELRWKTFYAIYTNAFMDRYTVGGGLLWGHRDRLRWGSLHWGGGVATGQEPIGNYPIHILVNNGRITLVGAVETTAEKTAAELEARGVPGSFGVESQILVHGK